MIIESNKVSVTASPETVLNFLSDSSNILYLLPQDKISDFKSTVQDCSFKVQGGVTISLIQDGRKDNDEIYLKSGASSPFPFRLTIRVTPNAGGCEGYLHFDGEVNMFLKMMVEKPLTNLFNYMSDKLREHFSA